MSTTDLLLIFNLCIGLFVVILLLTRCKGGGDSGDWKTEFSVFGAELNKIGPLLRDELTRSREEGQRMSRETREELGNSVKLFSGSLTQHFQSLLTQLGQQGVVLTDRLVALAKTNEDKFEKLIQTNEANLKEFRDQLMTLLKAHREEAGQSAKEGRIELTSSLKAFEETFTQKDRKSVV